MADAVHPWVKPLNEELDRRSSVTDKLDRYHAGYFDPPEHIAEVRLEPEYQLLLRQAATNWPELIVSSRLDRLEVTGFNFGDKETDKRLWNLWQRSGLDADSGLIHEAALVDGRAYAIIWTDDDGEVEIVPEHASTTVVAYSVTSRRRRVAALRRWVENDRWYCTLYLPDEIRKYQAPEKNGAHGSATNVLWEQREVDGEEWPLPNPLGVVPVVEYAVNRTLSGYQAAPGALGQPRRVGRAFGSGAGEFERVIPIIDRINTTVFNGLLAQLYISFPIRALIGQPIEYEQVMDKATGEPVTDSSGEPIEVPKSPLRAAINRLIQIEDPQGDIKQLPAGSLDNFIKFAESHIRHLAAITNTPAHYLLGELVNISADGIRASEAGLISTVRGHHLPLGESHEETVIIADAVDRGTTPDLSLSDGETKWKDPESRSMAERADAGSKLKDILPWEALAEVVLQATPQQIARWQQMRSDSVFAGVLAAGAESMNGPGAPQVPAAAA